MSPNRPLLLLCAASGSALSSMATPRARRGRRRATGEVVVTSVRASLDQALATKRDVETIVDSISSSSGLGKFPSRNVADALGNVAGVVVQRTGTALASQATSSGGEGQFITIRGLGEDFSLVTLNGRILLATEQRGAPVRLRCAAVGNDRGCGRL